jgi:hypothetical protein
VLYELKYNRFKGVRGEGKTVGKIDVIGIIVIPNKREQGKGNSYSSSRGYETR